MDAKTELSSAPTKFLPTTTTTPHGLADSTSIRCLFSYGISRRQHEGCRHTAAVKCRQCARQKRVTARPDTASRSLHSFTPHRSHAP